MTAQAATLITSATLCQMFGGGQAVSTCTSCGDRIEGHPAKHGDEPVHLDARGNIYHERCLPPVEPVSDRERQLLALAVASPLRAKAGRVVQSQHNTDELPLFLVAQEPPLL